MSRDYKLSYAKRLTLSDEQRKPRRTKPPLTEKKKTCSSKTPSYVSSVRRLSACSCITFTLSVQTSTCTTAATKQLFVDNRHYPTVRRFTATSLGQPTCTTLALSPTTCVLPSSCPNSCPRGFPRTAKGRGAVHRSIQIRYQLTIPQVTEAAEKEWAAFREERAAGIEEIKQLRQRVAEEDARRRKEREQTSKDEIEDKEMADEPQESKRELAPQPEGEMEVDDEIRPEPETAESERKDDLGGMRADDEDAVEY